MNKTHFAVKASLLASMLLSGQSFAQSLPDEINHPQYLRTYQNLEQVLNQKVADYDKLSSQKAEIEKLISQMEKDQIELPSRNAELQRLIEARRQEVTRLSSELQGLEGVLGKIIEDLKRIDNMLAQLQRDFNEESARGQQIQNRRNQVENDVAQINARLEREIREENQSVQVLNRTTGEMNAAIERRKEVEKERSQLIRDVDRFRSDIPQARNTLNQTNAALGVKKSQASEAQSKLPAIKTELAQEEAKLSQIDVTLNPKKAQLNAMKFELGRISPDIARLQAENKTLEQKIAANQAKINSSNLNALTSKRDSLEGQVASVKAEINQNNARMIELQESTKPTLAQINELTIQLRKAQAERNTMQATILKAQIEALNKSIEPQKVESLRISKETERLALSIASTQMEITNLNNQITNFESQVSALRAEIESSKAKIAENEKKIAEQSQANSGLSQQIIALEAEVKTLESQRDPTARKVANLKQQESQVSASIAALNKDIQQYETEIQRTNARIADMEKTVASFPQESRRLENHVRQLDEKISQNRSEIDREQRLLARIRQDRVTVQAERDRAQSVLNQVILDLENSNRLAGAIRNKITEETKNREALTRYNQDSIRKLDALKVSKSKAEQEIIDASEEIKINEEDIATIRSELPKERSNLNVITPKVKAAESAKATAQKNAADANTQYQTRLSLYQTYLTEAQTLGTEKAKIGSSDGTKAGAIEARTKANKLASENALSHGKWEALRRAYVRGEITGFKNGFELGMNSSADATRGEKEGALAGSRRAKDHANMVIKPERYLEELERRLKDDTTQDSVQVAKFVLEQAPVFKSMVKTIKETVPDLTAAEIEEADRIISSLDNLIAQSEIEIAEVLELRAKLTEARNVYSTPGAGENQNTANCSAVYKSVKDFVDACKASYASRYQTLYQSAHSESFKKDYKAAFVEQIDRVFETELTRLYPVYFKEAANVGKEVGVATGKKEIYQQSFSRAENTAYVGTLPSETARVEQEAINLVQEHLNQNSSLALKGAPSIVTSSMYGISPGVEADLKMLVKNIGSQPSSGNSIVKITNISQNASPERMQAPLTTVEARSQKNLSVTKIKIDDAAVPGSKVLIAGEITHPGNHYRSSRVETFQIESLVGVNPTIETKLEFDNTPRVAIPILGSLKKQPLDITLTPKYTGVELGYEFSLEEVGSSFLEITSRPAQTEVLKRGQSKKIQFVYKISKAARGKTVALKVSVKYEGKVVSEQTIELKPQ